MTTIRTFIAIELSADAKIALINLQNRFKTIVPPRSVRWTSTKNIHLTLHFLGDTAVADVDKIGQVLRTAAQHSSPFRLNLGGLGCFPNSKRPRVLWVGLLKSSAPLTELHRKLGIGLQAEVGFTPKTRPYAPHLTLGRVKKGIPARQLKQLSQTIEREQPNIGNLAVLRATEITLIKSELTPAGPDYTQLSQEKFRVG